MLQTPYRQALSLNISDIENRTKVAGTEARYLVPFAAEPEL